MKIEQSTLVDIDITTKWPKYHKLRKNKFSHKDHPVQEKEYKARAKANRDTPDYKAKRKAYRSTPDYKARRKAYQNNPEYKAKIKAIRDTPVNKARRKAYQNNPVNKARRKANEKLIKKLYQEYFYENSQRYESFADFRKSKL